jgi:hypothetical protein
MLRINSDILNIYSAEKYCEFIIIRGIPIFVDIIIPRNCEFNEYLSPCVCTDYGRGDMKLRIVENTILPQMTKIGIHEGR